MSMRWDPLLAAALARELHGRLHRARLRAFLLDGDSRRVHLFFRETTLVFELHPTAGWVSLLDPVEPLPDARALSARVLDVRALPDESAIVIGLQRVRGKDEGVELALEWTGNRWNAAVVGYRSRVIRHVLVPREERSRSLTVGATYRPPLSTGRAGVDDEIPAERWDALLAEAGPDPEDRRRALLRGVAWTSSLNVDRLVEPGGRDRWLKLRDPTRWAAYIVELPRGLQPYPHPLPPPPTSGVENLLAAVDRARAAAAPDADRASLLLPARLLERAEKRLHRIEGRARGLRRELEKTSDPDPVRATGDLILARYGEVERGTTSTVLTGFDGSEIEVELDPTLPVHENAKRYYDEAARIERARAELPRRIAEAEARIEEWRGLVEGLRNGRTDPEEIARRLGPDRRRGKGPGGGQATDASLPYRSFRSSGGLEIRVGKGSRSNDELTFHHSAPDDVWLHVRQAPGAHVILRWTAEGSPPRRDLAEAAVLAAVHSEARHSGSVPVDWTRRKHVRKPRKSPPGAVLPGRVETLFVEPDAKLVDRLAVEDG